MKKTNRKTGDILTPFGSMVFESIMQHKLGSKNKKSSALVDELEDILSSDKKTHEDLRFFLKKRGLL